MGTNICDQNREELLQFIRSNMDQNHPESYLIATLHKAQTLYGHLSQTVMDEIAYAMNIPTAHIWGVATFYHFFNLKPQGKYVISVCLGTACYVKGAQEVLDAIKKEFKLDIGGTTEDQCFTLQGARCLGACGLAPVMMVNEKIYGDLTPKEAIKILKSLRKQG